MSNISDIIEQFILDTMNQDSYIEISRNSLADYFNCAPSQINYVLQTRFTLDRGFSKESRRGGGGFIKLSRLSVDDDISMKAIENVGDELSSKRMNHILQRLCADKIISKKQQDLVKVILGDEALALCGDTKDRVRANAFKCYLIELLKDKGDD